MVTPFFNRLKIPREGSLSTKSAGQMFLQLSKVIAFSGAGGINFMDLKENVFVLVLGSLVGVGISIPIGRKISDKKFDFFVNILLGVIAIKVLAEVLDKNSDIDILVEGHTDNVPIKNATLLDNWDLSVKRSTSIVRVLQNDLGVSPKQLIPAGRSSYIPLVENDSPANRAKNRRTKIIIMPKIDQFYEMVESEMKNLSGK
jgi:hypothetical protein